MMIINASLNYICQKNRRPMHLQCRPWNYNVSSILSCHVSESVAWRRRAHS